MNGYKPKIFTRGDLTFLVDDNSSAVIIGHENKYNHVYLTIPAEVKYEGITYLVKRIGYKAFYNCTYKRILARHIEIVGDYAFQSSINLLSVYLDCSCVEIGFMAFNNCRFLQHIHSAVCVKRVDGFAFAECPQLETVEIPNKLQFVGLGVFHNSPYMQKTEVTQTA